MSETTQDQGNDPDQKPERAWYQKPPGIILALLFWWAFLPWYIWTKTNWPKAVKAGATGFLGFFLLIVLIASVASPSQEESKVLPEKIERTESKASPEEVKTTRGTTAKQEEPAEAKRTTSSTSVLREAKPEYPSPAQKTTFSDFYDEVMRIHGQADKAMAEYQTALAEASESENILTAYVVAYSSISDTRDTVKSSWLALEDVTVPSSLSSEHNEALEESKDLLTSGLFTKQEGLAKLLQFIDDQKPSQLAEAQSKLEKSDEYMIMGVAKLVGVQSELGLLPEE